MSFVRLTADDFVVSTDAISATAWTTGNPTLSTFFTSSTQENGSSGDYYLNIYNTGSDLSGSAVQFAIAYGNSFGRGGVISLTDNSQYVSSVQFTEAGRVFQLISGSAGTKDTSVNTDGYSNNSGSYGWLLPDIGTILINPLALSCSLADGGIDFRWSGSASASAAPNLSPIVSLYKAISGSTASTFTINSQENITSDFVFVRPRSSEFNYSENPSYISGSTGEVLYSSFINNPQTYITTIGLYNDTNELLAVAKLSRPLNKNFTKEALVRVKLDF
jgi:hypothetical protein